MTITSDFAKGNKYNSLFNAKALFTENCQYVLNRDSEKKFTKLVTKMWKGFEPKKFSEEKGMCILFYTTTKSFQIQ